MNLQPLYDVKERLEYAAIAGTGLLGEDFRLQRAVENLKPLAGASPVFAKIDSGLQKLLSAPAQERSGQLLDVLALVDAVAYTQAGTGGAGELEPLPSGAYTYQQISYNQMNPLLAALTTTGGGRMEVIQNAWENHPEFFLDYRVLPAVVAGLGDGYGEIADLNGEILKKLGPAVIPLLKSGFDPAGNREMARRVEVISEVEREQATPWLREILPSAKKDIRAAVITALGWDSGNLDLLLDLTKSERGKNREAALEALAKHKEAELQPFWSEETAKYPQSAKFLWDNQSGWASDLIASAFRTQVEAILAKGELTHEGLDAVTRCRMAALGKTSPAMLNFWRWMDGQRSALNKLKGSARLSHIRLGDEMPNWLRESLRTAGPGPLCDLSRELWETHRNEACYLSCAMTAALLTHSAAEVYDEFSPYIPIKKTIGFHREEKQPFHDEVLKALSLVYRHKETGVYCIGGDGYYHTGAVWPLAQPLDKRWFERLVQSVCKDMGTQLISMCIDSTFREAVGEFDEILNRLADPKDEETCKLLIPYLRKRMVEEKSPFVYSLYLFRLGGSPKGVLGEAMKKGKPAYLFHVWQLLDEAAKVLPAGEVAELCQEVLDAKWLRRSGVDLELANQALPWTVEQLRAGKPFPAWDDWWSMRK